VDIRLVQSILFPQYDVRSDWQLRDDGTLDERQALATAVIVALGTDGLADREDILPDPDSTDRAGWWGDTDAEEIWGGWPIGSRLWLLKRSKIEPPGSRNGATTTRIDGFIREAIQPLIDQRIASRMDVDVARVGPERIDARVIIYRGPTLQVELRYQVLWTEMLLELE
jgi:phage gp46-like protein